MDQDRYTIGKLYPKTSCPTQDSLVRYAEGTLSPAELRSVELHLADCPLCDEALEGILLAGTNQFSEMATELGERVNAHLEGEHDREVEPEGGKVIEFRPNINPPMAQRRDTATPTARSGFRRVFPILSIAAGLALVATLSIFYMNRVTASGIAEEHFMAMEGNSRRGFKTVEPKSPDSTQAAVSDAERLAEEAYATGMSRYNAKDYSSAATYFDKDHSSKAKLYAGDCYYLLGRYDLAAFRYQSVIDAANGWEDNAEYNLALTYLKMNEVAQARMVLESIKADASHDFNGVAKETLEQVLDL